MPVVIKELVITATVDAPAPASADAAADAPAADAALVLTRLQTQRLVQSCVAQVLAVLREQAER
ncbi:MAG TPA: DUF5908 family protein [Hymenobacter sp.]|uniref:DUF5908 family protein n=1 Tax=Hymenobacter sp. TaxID=1898978 RepID=UPI002D7E559F|nr:DUF5908 family protein [Hymenobacter sp.]HET9503303.1 DUF5908 family protein [Hymenobacter sp.]